MKNLNLLLILALVFSATAVTQQSLSISLGNRITISQGSAYKLSCSNSYGQVIYNIEGLPEGARLDGDSIILGNQARSGNFVLRVKAVDAAGNSGSQIITLSTVVVDAEEQLLEEVGRDVSNAVRVQSAASRLSNIIGSYSSVESLTTRPPTDFPENKFPTEDFPTGGNDDTFNPTPATIFTRNARPSDNTRNEVTIDDVALRAASERHQNAVKGITNLLKLIDQARANKKQAERDVQVLTESHNVALQNQKRAQNAIISVENRIVQIKSATETLEDEIIGLRQQIDDAVAAREDLQRKKTQILDVITSKERKKAQLVDQVNKVNNKLADTITKLASQLQICQGIESEFNQSVDQLNKLKDQFAEITRRRQTAESDVDEKRDIVDDLRKQLAKAEKELSKAEVNLRTIIAEEERIPRLIKDLENQIRRLEKRLDDCEAKADDIRHEIEKLENDQTLDLTSDINNLEDDILTERRKVSDIDTELAKGLTILQDLRDKLKKSEDDIVFLRDQLRISQEDLRRVYTLGNQANTKVIHAKENLDTAILRFRKESRIVSDATLNLERVRAEESLARLALEEIISKYSDALPYSIVPNGNGQNVGTPAGNNPSGSALGASLSSRAITSFSSTTEFTSFVSGVFGQGISIRQSIDQVFSVRSRANAGLRSDQCVLSSEGVVSGEVLSVSSSNIDLLSNQGEVFNVDLSGCTNVSSNIQDRLPKVGDLIYVKGNTLSARNIEALELLCLA